MRYRVVLVPFPFDDLSGSKVRPAVVVPPGLEPTDVLLDPGSVDFVRSGLRVRSALRLHRLATVSAAIIQRQLGVLTPNLQTQVQQRLRALFAL